MPKREFDRRIPVEFWREVVDRVAAEAPGTLLLAEACWMMEGYFVRTLGMHRVYNSAFMHMMRDEDNAKYRVLMKNTLEFDPEILRRYVNFQNNPDERTAVDQFGKGDKYFGICTVMLTMPGLPMLGHGQIEGFTEKYGLEYIRSSNELIEQGLYAELGAYKCQVFLDFRQVRDDPLHQYAQITGFLAGRGVPSIEEALKELFLQPIHYPFKELVNADLFR